MIKFNSILLIFFWVVIIACNNSHSKLVIPKVLPKDLNSAMNYINNNFSVAERYRFKNETEEDAVSDLHFSIGLWIRNNWIYAKRDTLLVEEFNKLGVFSPDDISSMILVSLHRKLNNKPIKLIEQADKAKVYWKVIQDCEKSETIKAVNNYNRFKIGDPIIILMAVDTTQNQRNAIMYDCPSVSWSFDHRKDLKINGIVENKYFINSDSNVFFKVRIKSMNFTNTRILSDTVNVGEIKDFSLSHLRIQ